MPNPVVLRREVIEIGRLMAEQGLIVAAEGNLSVRLGGFSFLVTPSGLDKGRLRPQDLLEVDDQGRAPRGRVTSEWPLHREIYRLRPDVGGICHAHAPWATAFAVAGRDLDGTLLTETARTLPRVPLARRAEPGTRDLPLAVGPWIRAHDAVLLGNHGVVTVGRDLPAAFAVMQTVERLAQVTLLSEMAAGRCGLAPEVRQALLGRAAAGQPPA